MFAFYAQWRFPPPLEEENFKPGWHTLDIRLQRVYARKRLHNHQIYGQGILVDSPSLPPKFRRQRLYFMLYENVPQEHYRGQIIRIRAHLQCLGKKIYKPHSFETYLQRVRIPLQVDRGNVRTILREGPTFFRRCYQWQQRALAILSLPQEDISILRCLLLNDRACVQRSQKRTFTHTGVAHLLAISGLHIGIIGLVLEYFFRLFQLSKKQRRIPCILILGLYTCVIGAPPSAIRAFLMLTYAWSACFFSRRTTALSAISFSGIIALLIAPHQLWDLGFQFSYIAVFCIIFLGNPLASYASHLLYFQSTFATGPTSSIPWKKFLRWALSYNLQSLCISAPISLLTIPLSIEYFGSFSLSGIFVNLIAIPLAFGLITAGLITLIIGLLLGNACSQWLLAHLLLPYLQGFKQILHWCDIHLPYFWERQTLATGTGIATFLLMCTFSLIFHHHRLKNFLRIQTHHIAMLTED
jgi:ComEC/Rec2-related protein